MALLTTYLFQQPVYVVKGSGNQTNSFINDSKTVDRRWLYLLPPIADSALNYVTEFDQRYQFVQRASELRHIFYIVPVFGLYRKYDSRESRLETRDHIALNLTEITTGTTGYRYYLT